MQSSKINDTSLKVAYGLASIFAAWASYRIHVIGIEDSALPVFSALLDFEGRAPDQYRVIPYFLIGLIQKIISIFPNVSAGIYAELRYPVLIFDSIFLCLSVLAIRKHFSNYIGSSLIWNLLLIYPFLMFDGYRPITSFILFLSIHTVVLMRRIHSGEGIAWKGLSLMIVIFSFTRSDVAFLFAVSSLGLNNGKLLLKLALAVIPLAAQFLLSNVIFPDAQYFSPVVMIVDNLSLKFLIGSPLTYLFSGLLILFRVQVTNFLRSAFISHRATLIAMVGYTLTLCVIARPNEYRLFHCCPVNFHSKAI